MADMLDWRKNYLDRQGQFSQDDINRLTGDSRLNVGDAGLEGRYSNLIKMGNILGFVKAKNAEIGQIEPGGLNDIAIAKIEAKRDEAEALARSFGEKACWACSHKDSCSLDMYDKLYRMSKSRRKIVKDSIEVQSKDGYDVDCRTILCGGRKPKQTSNKGAASCAGRIAAIDGPLVVSHSGGFYYTGTTVFETAEGEIAVPEPFLMEESEEDQQEPTDAEPLIP